MAARKSGDLWKFPTRFNESEERPERPHWQYDPPGGSEALFEMTERAVKALGDLKAALMATIHLSDGVKKKIAAASSSAEISEIINAAQQPGESPVAAAPVGQKLVHRFYIGNLAFDAVGDSTEQLAEQESRTRRHYAAQEK